jgi:serine protease inhibitor
LQHFIRNSSDHNKTIIKLPKLKLESRLDLKSLLSSVGLTSIFDSRQGSLCMIQNSDAVYIDGARQIVKLSLDETGTEVAAVTIALPKAEAIRPQAVKYNKFYADHPFVLVLFDSQTQAILLTAAIVHPEEK